MAGLERRTSGKNSVFTIWKLMLNGESIEKNFRCQK